MKRIAFAAMVVAATTMAAHAQTGMDLHRQCGNGLTAGFLNRDYCHSYITGIVNGAVTSGSHTICLSQGVTDTQSVMIVQNYMRAHPEQLNQPAPIIIQQAMSEAFPCPTILAPFGSRNAPGSPARTSGEAPQWFMVGGTLFIGAIVLALMVAALAGAVALAKAAVRAARR
jgi:hypothetical protein